MKNLLLLTYAGLGDRGRVGAPTFWKTVEGFIAAGWKVWVVDIGTAADTPLGVQEYEDGLYIIRFNPPFLRQSGIRKIGWFFRLADTAWITKKLKAEAEKLIAEKGLTGSNTLVYGLEIFAVKAAKAISEKYGMPLETRFYGTFDMQNTLRNRVMEYPAFQAMGTEADFVLMTDDGTCGDEVLLRAHNVSRNQKFWRNGVDIPGDTAIPADIEQRLDKGPMLMTLCRLNDWKHVDRAIDALPKVLEQHPETTLVVCGYGPEREALEEQASRLNVAEHVFFTGSIEHDLAFAYMKRADIFLSMYDYSNLGNPLFEALRCGKPIITLDVGATDTVITNGENGIMISPDELYRIPEEICRLLGDENERARLRDNALRFTKENFWTWDERIAAELREAEALLPQSENA